MPTYEDYQRDMTITANSVGNGWAEFTGDDGKIIKLYGEMTIETSIPRETWEHLQTFYDHRNTTYRFLFHPKPGKIDDAGSLYTVQVPKKKTATVTLDVPSNTFVDVWAIAEPLGFNRGEYNYSVEHQAKGQVTIEFEEK